MKKLLLWLVALALPLAAVAQTRPSTVLSQGAVAGSPVQYCGFTAGVPVLCPAGGSAPQTFFDIQTSSRPFIDVRAFGPVGQTCVPGSIDTAAVQAAVNAAQRSTQNCGTNSIFGTANCAGVVFFPNVFCTASHVKMASYITLLGTGPENSGLVQLAGSNQHFITGTSPTVDQRMVIEGLSINGNKTNQTGTFDCIHWDGTGALGTVRSTRNRVSNSWAFNCGQDGISDFGDAGSDYIIGSKGFANGRYGLNLDKYDSHTSAGEWFSNGVAGLNLGTHGNGSADDYKAWGNGTGTTGNGTQVGSGNWRVNSADLQDNFCFGITATGNNLILQGLLLNGNGQAGGGLGCGGMQLTAVNYSLITGSFVAHVDAGTSDYAAAFVGANNTNIIIMPISNASPPLVSSYSGTINNNIWLGNTVNGMLFNSLQVQFLNGEIIRGFSDTGGTQQWSILGNIGQFNPKSLTVNGGQQISNNPRFSFGGTSGTAFTSTVTGYGGGYTPTSPITVTAIDLHLDTTPVGCTAPFAATGLYDVTAAAFVAGAVFTLANSTVNYHINLATPQNIAAGHLLEFGTQTAWNTSPACSTNGGGPHFTVEYIMQ